MNLKWTFQTRIGVLFGAITIVLTVILSRFSYIAVREVYLEQFSAQTRLSARAASVELDPANLRFLNPSVINSLAGRHYQRLLEKHQTMLELESVFIFDSQKRIIAASDSFALSDMPDPVLALNNSEIESLEPGDAVASLPFLGHDGFWYMWGFYRLDPSYWVGVRANARQLAYIEKLSWIFWGIGAGGLVLSIAGSFVVARMLSRPVAELVGFSRSLGRGEWQAPVPKSVQGELASLAFAMDQMRTDLLSRHKEKEALISQIAHEIRNPLGSIELLAGLVSENPTGEKSSEYLLRIREEIAGLRNLVHHYLELGKPSPAVTAQIELQPILQDVEQILSKEISDKNIKIDRRLNRPKIWFDHGHLRQILINLYANAIAAVPKGGSVLIRSYQDHDEMFLDVSDNGPGVPAEWLGSIFDPFFTKRGDGNGLGLAICRKLADENGSVISARNEPGGGFTITIMKKLGPEDMNGSF